ncbi:putative programmed cell death protein [Clavispora lusitaniae]|nr:putative programmed cell death protein [Clavispora lusitaniae]
MRPDDLPSYPTPQQSVYNIDNQHRRAPPQQSQPSQPYHPPRPYQQSQPSSPHQKYSNMSYATPPRFQPSSSGQSHQQLPQHQHSQPPHAPHQPHQPPQAQPQTYQQPQPSHTSSASQQQYAPYGHDQSHREPQAAPAPTSYQPQYQNSYQTGQPSQAPNSSGRYQQRQYQATSYGQEYAPQYTTSAPSSSSHHYVPASPPPTHASAAHQVPQPTAHQVPHPAAHQIPQPTGSSIPSSMVQSMEQHSISSHQGQPMASSGHGQPQSASGHMPVSQPASSSGRSGKRVPSEKPLSSKKKLEMELRVVFDKVDLNRSGKISVHELSQALSNFDNTKFQDSTVRLMINLFTTNHSSSLNFEQFISLWKHLTAYKKLFVAADQNKSGDISFGELQQIIEQIGYKLNVDLVLHLFQKFANKEQSPYDTQIVGKLKFDAFIELLVYLRRLTDIFKKYDNDQSGVATIEYSDFLFEISSLSM